MPTGVGLSDFGLRLVGRLPTLFHHLPEKRFANGRPHVSGREIQCARPVADETADGPARPPPRLVAPLERRRREWWSSVERLERHLSTRSYERAGPPA